MLSVQYNYTYSYQRFQASATKQMRTTLFWEITQRTVLFADVSEEPIGPIFKGHTSIPILSSATILKKWFPRQRKLTESQKH